jgi:hypothetical protein
MSLIDTNTLLLRPDAATTNALAGLDPSAQDLVRSALNKHRPSPHPVVSQPGRHRAPEPEPVVEVVRSLPGERTVVIPPSPAYAKAPMPLPARAPGAALAAAEHAGPRLSVVRELLGALRLLGRGGR